MLQRARRCFHKRFYELWFVAQFVVNLDRIQLEKNADQDRRDNCDHPHVNLKPLFCPILCTAEPALKPVVSLRRGALYRRAEASKRVQNGFVCCSGANILAAAAMSFSFTRDSIAGRSNRCRAATNPRAFQSAPWEY